MQMTLRWYGSKHDSVTLEQIRQIPGVKSVITTLYDSVPGEAWSLEDIRAMKKEVEAAIPYLEKRVLSDWVHRKTIQKAVESYRITPEQKVYLKSLRGLQL